MIYSYEFKKIGFKTKKDATKYIKENKIRKQKNETNDSYLNRIKQHYIDKQEQEYKENQEYLSLQKDISREIEEYIIEKEKEEEREYNEFLSLQKDILREIEEYIREKEEEQEYNEYLSFQEDILREEEKYMIELEQEQEYQQLLKEQEEILNQEEQHEERLDILRPLRRINNNNGLIHQDTENSDTFYEAIQNSTIIALNKEIMIIRKMILDSIKENNVIYYNELFTIRSYVIDEVESILTENNIGGSPLSNYPYDIEEGITFAKGIYINLKDGLIDNNCLSINKELSEYLNNEDNEKITTVNFSQHDSDTINNEINLLRHISNLIYAKLSNDSQNIRFMFIITKYIVVPALQNERNRTIDNYSRTIRAFLPTINQQYHLSTICSTTQNKQCIYQTYYYLYRDNTKLISRNERNISLCLENETEDIKLYINKGELLNFLISKSNEHNENMYVRFYKESQFLGFVVYPNGSHCEIKSINEFNNKKVFLYDNSHVAPQMMVNMNNLSHSDFINKSTNNEQQLNIEQINNKSNNKTNKNTNTYSLPKQIIKSSDKKRECVILGYDCEVYVDKKNKNNAYPYCLCLSNGESFYGKSCISDFKKYLDTLKIEVDISKTRSKKSVKQYLIYGFNNSRFDNIFIFNELRKDNKNIKYLIDNNSIKYIKYHNIRFYDVNQFYLGSLESVSESFNLTLKKSIFPYKFVNSDNLEYVGQIPDIEYWNKESDMEQYINENGNMFNMKEYTLKYCFIDCKITYELANIHIKNSTGNIGDRSYDLRTAISSSSLSTRFYSQAFQSSSHYSSPNNIQVKERSSYHGGKVDVFKKVYEKIDNGKKLSYIDINSSYPYSMTSEMPDKYIKTIKLGKEKQIYIENLLNCNLYHARSVYKGSCKSFIPNLLVLNNKKCIISPKSAPYSYFWGIELAEAILNGCEIFIDEINEYTTSKPFEEFVTYLYNERLKSKKSNPALAAFYKMIMNSFYGKLGQKERLNNKICSDSSDIFDIMSNKDNTIDSYNLLDDDSLIIKYRNINDSSSNTGNLVRFASYISAASRTNLSKMMRILGHDSIYYCDTDSIFTDAEIPLELLSNDELGKWKIESINDKDNNKILLNDIDFARFLAPKALTYRASSVSICKGKSVNNNNLEPKHYDTLIYPDGAVIRNDAMFFRSLNGVIIKRQDRTLSERLNKRIFRSNNSEAYETIEDYENNY